MKRMIALAAALTVPWTLNAATNADLMTGNPMEAKYMDYISVEGTVQNIDTENNRVEIQDKNGVSREFKLDPNTYVWKSSERAEIGDVQTGSPVLINYLRDSMVVTSLISDYDSEIQTQ